MTPLEQARATTAVLNERTSYSVALKTESGHTYSVTVERKGLLELDRDLESLSEPCADNDRELPNSWAISCAKHIVVYSYTLAPASRVGASVEGGVVVHFRGRNGRYAFCDCYNTGSVILVRSDGTMKPHAITLKAKQIFSLRTWKDLSSYLEGHDDGV